MRKLLCLLSVCCALSVNAITVVPGIPLHHTYPLKKTADGLMEVYKGIDPKIISSGDEEAVSAYLLPYNAKVLDYIKDHYGEDLTAYFEPDDPMILFCGFLLAHFETLPDGSATGRYMDGFQCIYYAIGAGIGVKELIASYQALVNGGASINALLGLFKNFARRYVAWYVVGYTIYKFGDCMEWW